MAGFKQLSGLVVLLDAAKRHGCDYSKTILRFITRVGFPANTYSMNGVIWMKA